MSDSIADVLDRATDLLNCAPGGWGKCGKDRISGRHCVATAISSADPSYDPRESKALLYFAEFLGVDGRYGVYEWNDAPERTKEQVLSALRNAATLARQGTQP